jgi:CheY-like chemotaxis protein
MEAMSAKILIIEDDNDSRELVTYLLATWGHATMSAINGERGLQIAAAEHPDLIICDLQMPVVDGYAVIRRLREDAATRATPTIAVTAFSMTGDRESALAAGFNGYLSKPIDPETFVEEIEQFLTPNLRGGRRPAPS